MARRRYKLRNLDVDRVDLVDAGANQFADIVIVKSDDKRAAITEALIAKNKDKGYPEDTQLKNGPPPVKQTTIKETMDAKDKKKKKGAKGSAFPERNAAESSTSAGTPPPAEPVEKHTPGGKDHDQSNHAGGRGGGGKSKPPRTTGTHYAGTLNAKTGKWRDRRFDTREGVDAYIARDAGDAPASRYGRSSFVWRPVAVDAVFAMQNATGEPITEDGINHIVGLVVNDHDDIEYLLENYGERGGHDNIPAGAPPTPSNRGGGFARPGGGRPADEGTQSSLLEERLLGEFTARPNALPENTAADYAHFHRNREREMGPHRPNLGEQFAAWQRRGEPGGKFFKGFPPAKDDDHDDGPPKNVGASVPPGKPSPGKTADKPTAPGGTPPTPPSDAPKSPKGPPSDGEGLAIDPNGPGPALGPGSAPGKRPTQTPDPKAVDPKKKTKVPDKGSATDEKRPLLADVLRNRGKTPSAPQKPNSL